MVRRHLLSKKKFKLNLLDWLSKPIYWMNPKPGQNRHMSGQNLAKCFLIHYLIIHSFILHIHNKL